MGTCEFGQPLTQLRFGGGDAHASKPATSASPAPLATLVMVCSSRCHPPRGRQHQQHFEDRSQQSKRQRQWGAMHHPPCTLRVHFRTSAGVATMSGFARIANIVLPLLVPDALAAIALKHPDGFIGLLKEDRSPPFHLFTARPAISVITGLQTSELFRSE